MLWWHVKKYKPKCNNCGFGVMFFNKWWIIHGFNFLTYDSGINPLAIISLGKEIMVMLTYKDLNNILMRWELCRVLLFNDVWSSSCNLEAILNLRSGDWRLTDARIGARMMDIKRKLELELLSNCCQVVDCKHSANMTSQNIYKLSIDC